MKTLTKKLDTMAKNHNKLVDEMKGIKEEHKDCTKCQGTGLLMTQNGRDDYDLELLHV